MDCVCVVVSKEEAPHALGCDGFRVEEVCALEVSVTRSYDDLGDGMVSTSPEPS